MFSKDLGLETEWRCSTVLALHYNKTPGRASGGFRPHRDDNRHIGAVYALTTKGGGWCVLSRSSGHEFFVGTVCICWALPNV
jgi:hypothetical protein